MSEDRFEPPHQLHHHLFNINGWRPRLEKHQRYPALVVAGVSPTHSVVRVSSSSLISSGEKDFSRGASKAAVPMSRTSTPSNSPVVGSYAFSLADDEISLVLGVYMTTSENSVAFASHNALRIGTHNVSRCIKSKQINNAVCAQPSIDLVARMGGIALTMDSLRIWGDSTTSPREATLIAATPSHCSVSMSPG